MTAFYVCAAITALSAFTSLGFGLYAARHTVEKTSRAHAMYAVSRSAALAAASVVPFFYHSVPWLTAIALVMIVVQAIDVGIGVALASPLKIFGPALAAAFNTAALLWLLVS